MARAQGKHREFDINCSVATLLFEQEKMYSVPLITTQEGFIFSVYLSTDSLRRGVYASCGHVGGISC